jgi:hypothetical protein
MCRKHITRLYHLADDDNLASIEQLGLLSTSRLIERAGLSGTERARIERAQRRERMVLPGGAVIRDQKPMPPGALARCLVDGTSPAEWYAILNSMVFFWFDPERLARQARACRSLQHVIEIDAVRMLARHHARAFVTPINIGNAMRRAARRGRATFVPYQSWNESGWTCEAEALGVPARPASHRPVEIAIQDAVPDIMKYVLSVRRFDLSIRWR